MSARRIIHIGRFKGTWETRPVPTATLEPGAVITVPGVGMWKPLDTVDHQDDGRTRITYTYDPGTGPRRAVKYRSTSGRTTIHVKVAD